MKNYSAQIGTQITVPVKVTGFNNVMSIQGTVQFDQTKLTYVSVQDFGLSGLNSTGFGTAQTGSGKLTFSWMEGTLAGINLSDSTTIFSIKFNIIGPAGQSSPLTFVNVPTSFEVLDPTTPIPVSIPYTWVNGSVSIYSTVSIPEVQGSGFQLYQNEPNPFTDETRFVFSLPEDGPVSFTVYDVLGNKVTAFEKEFQAGKRSLMFSANQIAGARLPGGTYFYRISCGKYSGMGKMLLIR
jgi:hypothetical protein